MIPKVMIILGSASDKDIALKSIKILEKLQIPYSIIYSWKNGLLRPAASACLENGCFIHTGYCNLSVYRLWCAGHCLFAHLKRPGFRWEFSHGDRHFRRVFRRRVYGSSRRNAVLSDRAIMRKHCRGKEQSFY